MANHVDHFSPIVRSFNHEDRRTFEDLPDWPFIVLDPGEHGCAGLFPPPKNWRTAWQMPIAWQPILGMDGISWLFDMELKIRTLWPQPEKTPTRAILLVEKNFVGHGDNKGTSLKQATTTGFFIGAFCSLMPPRSYVVEVRASSWQSKLGIKGKRPQRKKLARELAEPHIPASQAPETKAAMEAFCDVMGMASWWVRLKGSTAVRLGAC
jgi:hypothetical protein